MPRITVLLALAALPAVAAPDLPAMQAAGPRERILVVSPHPDDESLCCGGYIATARRAGAEVSIVWITSGGGYRFAAMVSERTVRPKRAGMRALARQRIDEAQNAAQTLGVEPARQFFLGYPDRGVLALLLDNYDSPYRSKYTQADSVLWEQAVSPGSPYEGASLERDFALVLDRVRPTLILAPSPYDSHPDHRATGILTLRVLGARGEQVRIMYWIVHGGRGWPAPRGLHPQRPQTPPPRGAALPWQQYFVAEDARESKRLALRMHETQLKVMGRKMMSFVRATELFSPLPIAATDRHCLEALPCLPEVPPEDEGSL